MSPIQNVVIIGAGGNLGPSVLKAFLDDQSYKVTVLSRASSTATFPDNVKVIKTDYSHASLLDAFKNQDAIISVVPGDKFAQQKDIIDAAVESGVKRFFPSEFGNDPESDEMRARVPLFFLKKQTADYLREVSAKNPDFTYTLLSTGPFFDWVSSIIEVFDNHVIDSQNRALELVSSAQILRSEHSTDTMAAILSTLPQTYRLSAWP